MLALLGIADHRPGSVVELQVAAARRVECRDRLAVCRRQIIEEGVEVRIDVAADGTAALPDMQRARRRSGHLRGDGGTAVEKAEMIQVRMTGEVDLPDHPHAFGFRLDAGELDALSGGIELHAVEPGVEVEMPPGAAEFAVRNRLQADRLLLLDDRPDL